MILTSAPYTTSIFYSQVSEMVHDTLRRILNQVTKRDAHRKVRLLLRRALGLLPVVDGIQDLLLAIEYES
jgi:hypothetical protein